MSVPALHRWLIVQALVWLTLLVGLAWRAAVGRFSPAWLNLGLPLLIASYAGLWYCLRPRGTPADRATLARFLALLAALAWVASTGTVTWPIWTLFLIVVTSDLVDGWLARRYGGSREGELLDMETDQLTTLVLAAVAAGVSEAGVWVLALPALKYVFALAMSASGVEAHQAKPVEGDNRRGKLICATVMTLLLVCILPPAPPAVRMAASALAVLLLCYSFAADAAFLLRAARRASTLG